MRKLAKAIFLISLIIAPIAICGILIIYSNSPLAISIAGLYLLFIAGLIIFLIWDNYSSIKTRFGLWPIYNQTTHRHTQKQLSQQTIAFVGDSVTYGYDDDNNGKQLSTPWSKEVSELLGCTVVNCGINSASLLSHSWTPISWVNEYNKIPSSADIIGFMIGINDCFRNYPLGEFSDNNTDTFYGGLHTLIKGLQQRFPADKGKKIFLIIYPHYDAIDTFKKYVSAMYEVADYYSIPICDLSITLGVSPYNDSDYLYWRKYPSNQFHSPHPTQATSHLIAEAIANYINSHFGIKSDYLRK